jgi:serine protease Do
MTFTRLAFFSLTAASLVAPTLLRGETIEELRERQCKVCAVVEKAMGSVVAITSSDPKVPGSGSGVIVQKDGLILTAAHVTQATGESIMITFPDGRRVKGVALGANRTTDAGMARITEEGEWPAVEIGSSDKMRLGDWCVAMGHPGGFSFDRRPPVRLGRIWQRDLDGAIRSSCPLIGGDSGGPLFDLEGRVIGINSSIHGSLEQNRHVAIDTLREDWDRMLKEKPWGRQVFGDDGRWPKIGATFDRDSQEGVKVENVFDDTPASKAELKPGDVVVKFDGTDVATFHHLYRLVGKKKAGDKVRIALRRGTETVECELELGQPGVGRRNRNRNRGTDPPNDSEREKSVPEPKVPEETGPRPFFGVELEDTAGKGAKVTSVKENSPAAKAGLVPNDLILRLNDKEIDGPTPAAEALRTLKPGDKLTVKAKRGDTELSVDATLEQIP